ncbi:hypothetical protein [Cohnella sp. 56]|uniref:hypothetical protein n=1 Tax=Cohnella sp. 56 TaxID=3113722 RepID=UPI0030EAAC36
MIKYQHRTGATLGSFVPFLVGGELVLTSVSLHGIAPGDEVIVGIEIGWANPMSLDMGELEIRLKRDAPDGETVEWSLESCFLSAVTRLEYRTTGGNPDQLYYLIVSSREQLARITGPYVLDGRVEAR